MKYRLFGVLALVTILSSCTQRKKIEIYLTKEQILNYDAIPAIESDSFISEVKSWSELEEHQIRERFKNIEWDTIENRAEVKSNFPVKLNDLKESPVVYDHEIKTFHLETGEIEITDEGLQRIAKHLKKKLAFIGQQYVITYDNEPILKGYFMSAFGIGDIGWYRTRYYSSYEEEDLRIERPFRINRIKRGEYYSYDVPELKDQSQFIEAFRATNRLIE